MAKKLARTQGLERSLDAMSDRFPQQSMFCVSPSVQTPAADRWRKLPPSPTPVVLERYTIAHMRPEQGPGGQSNRERGLALSGVVKEEPETKYVATGHIFLHICHNLRNWFIIIDLSFSNKPKPTLDILQYSIPAISDKPTILLRDRCIISSDNLEEQCGMSHVDKPIIRCTL